MHRFKRMQTHDMQFDLNQQVICCSESHNKNNSLSNAMTWKSIVSPDTSWKALQQAKVNTRIFTDKNLHRLPICSKVPFTIKNSFYTTAQDERLSRELQTANMIIWQSISAYLLMATLFLLWKFLPTGASLCKGNCPRSSQSCHIPSHLKGIEEVEVHSPTEANS